MRLCASMVCKAIHRHRLAEINKRIIVIAPVRPSVRPACYFLLNHWAKSNQIWCVSYSHEQEVQQHFFGPAGGVKRSNILKLQLQSQFQRFFIQNYVCVFTNKRYITYHTGFSFYRLGHAPVMGLWGAGGTQRVKKNRTGSCGISN